VWATAQGLRAKPCPAAGPPILHPQNALNNIEIAALSLDSNEPISSKLFRQISSVYMQ
jgi:hypothetical protein